MEIKFDIVLGFLGSGKTSLINLFLKSGEVENELVVIVLFECGKKEIIERAKNIVVIHRKDTDIFNEELLNFIVIEYMPNRIIVEYNGRGETEKFINSFNNILIGKILKQNKVINIIDSRRAEIYFKNTAKKIKKQIEYSDIVILSNSLGMDNGVVKSIKKRIKKINKYARIIEAADEGVEEELVNNRRICLNTENENLSNVELIISIFVFLFIIGIISILSKEII